jgi:hypothetical protein
MTGKYHKFVMDLVQKKIKKFYIKAFSNYDFVNFEAVSDNFSQWDYCTVKQAVK